MKGEGKIKSPRTTEDSSEVGGREDQKGRTKEDETVCSAR